MKILLVTDRATGECERIREDDPNYGESLLLASRRAGIDPLQALKILEDGQELVTPGFVRRIIRAQGTPGGDIP